MTNLLLLLILQATNQPMFKSLIFALILTTYYFLLSTNVSAQSSCPPIFGGGDPCVVHPNLTIDKKIEDPLSGQFLDALTYTISDQSEAENLIFRITIKNTSSNALSNISLTDTLPSVFTYVSGNGKYDPAKKTFTDTINKLEKNQSKEYTLRVTINPEVLEKASACSINQAVITQNNKKGSDYVKTCINLSIGTTVTSVEGATSKGGLKPTAPKTTKGGIPVFSQTKQSKTPDTGPEAVGIIGLPLIAGLGYWLREKPLSKKI